MFCLTEDDAAMFGQHLDDFVQLFQVGSVCVSLLGIGQWRILPQVISLDEHPHAYMLSAAVADRGLMRASYPFAQAANQSRHDRDVGKGEMIAFWLEMCYMLPENLTAVLEHAERNCDILGLNYIVVNHHENNTVHYNRLHLPRYAIKGSFSLRVT